VMLCACAAVAPSALKPSAAIQTVHFVTTGPSHHNPGTLLTARCDGSHSNFRDGAKAPEAIGEGSSRTIELTIKLSDRPSREETMNEATRIKTAAPAGELGANSEEFQNLHEFVRKARSNLNQNAWDYIVGAAETETTMRRN